MIQHAETRPGGGRQWARALHRLCFTIFLGLVALGGAGAEPRRYVIDPNHFSVGFLVDHLGYARVLGMFREAEGSFLFNEETSELWDVRITVETCSVFTNQEDRDKHLRSADFFHCKKFPEMTFVAETAKLDADRRGQIEGRLTLLGVTQPVEVDVLWNKSGESPMAEGVLRRKPYIAGVSVRGKFRRSDFGMDYGVDNEWVGDEVELILEFEARRQ